ncbi:MAG: hypothetical protein AB7J28_05820 [Hyphomonadaceae bacterium]
MRRFNGFRRRRGPGYASAMQFFRRSLRVFALALALFALTLKGAVPAGYMLSNEGGHRIAVTLCAGGGAPVAGVLNLETGRFSTQEEAPAQQQTHSDVCAFAFAAGAAPASDFLFAPAPLRAAYAPRHSLQASRQIIAPTGPPLPARGPPQHA